MKKEKIKSNPLDSMTEEEIKEVMEVAGLGLSRDDFSDDGQDLEELKQIIEADPFDQIDHLEKQMLLDDEMNGY